jgi:hypothetical protein
MGLSSRNGDTHQLPRVWAQHRYWTIVREPAEWLASLFANRTQDRWTEHPSECPFKYFTQAIKPYRTADFEEFVDSITTHMPGAVGWIFDCYTPPKVQVYRKGEEQREFLRSLGCDPDRQMPVNVSSPKIRPEVTDSMRYKIYRAEHWTYKRYGYTIDGEYTDYKPQRNEGVR